MIQTADLYIDEDDLLSAVWYSDGSGAHSLRGMGIEGVSDDWRITNIYIDDETRRVRISIARKPDDE